MVAEGYAHGEVLATGLTYEKAQERENAEAEARGCKAEPGGRPVDGAVWSVYVVHD